MSTSAQPWGRRLRWLLLAGSAGALPFVVTSGTGRLLMITALIYALLAMSWNLTLGFGGIFNFAHVGIFGLGGYVMAIATVRYEVNPWLGLVLAAAAGSAASALVFLPVIRMRGIYLALVTFIFVQLCYYLVLALSGLTGGSSGLPGVPGLQLGSFQLSEYGGLGWLWLLAFVVVALTVCLDVIRSGPFGWSLLAIRDNEDLARSRGMNRTRQHLNAFLVGGAFAGLAGACYVSFFHVADATLFSFGFVTFGLSMIFLGGSGYTWGPLIGALVLTVVDRNLNDVAAWRSIIIGTGTILVLLFMPRGLAGLLTDAVELVTRRRTSGNAPLPTQSEAVVVDKETHASR